MAGVIKSVLKEELQNSLRMRKAYEKALRALPEGSLCVKRIRGNEYCYLAVRHGDKVRFLYKGRMSAAERAPYIAAKKQRLLNRHLLSRVKKQIRYLRGALRGKEPI